MAPPTLFSAMQFSGIWRDYQARVLEEMDGFLDDGRLHIVAAPGSGKTVLGLEAMRRIGRPALVLSPSLTIRNQWAERLVPLFMPTLEAHADRVSRDLANPRDMTLATYQALHASWSADRGFAAIAALGPVTLVLDECHHLRREWWNALFALKDALEDVTIVALTATPPYDASQAEWTRYERLCGPMDAEIGVPELVRNGDLAPHQDFVQYSRAEGDLVETLMRRRSAVFALMDAVMADPDLPQDIQSHPFIADPFQHEEAILEAPQHLSAMLFYLHARDISLPDEPLSLLAVDTEHVPDFNHFWLEPMLECILNRKIGTWRPDAAKAAKWRQLLSEGGLISNRRIDFSESVELARLLAGSTAKLGSIAQIVQLENDALGNTLRMALLTDHVRAAEMPRAPDAPYAPSRLGVVPIFETLRRAGIGQPLGILTGTLVVIPEAAIQPAQKAALAIGVSPQELSFTPLRGCPGYVQLDFASAADRGRVALVTQLVEDGRIRVLVGTQALLGEGWDAPTINTLVLASNAASYMLSNQMRGRAIRTDPANPDKVANIWHLVTTDPSALEGEGADHARLAKRFAMFDGVAEDGTTIIENGIDRLDLASHQSIDERNRHTAIRARDRRKTARLWARSLGAGTKRAQVREVAEIGGGVGSAVLHVRNTIKSTFMAALGGGVVTAGMSLRGIGGLDAILAIGGGAAMLYALPGVYNSARLWLRNGTLERRLNEVGAVVLVALARTGNLSRQSSDYDVRVQEGIRGRHAVTIEGGTRADQHRFVDAMIELLGPVQNPRYILRREGESLGFRQLDYHAVPTALGGRKEHAELFQKLWAHRIGPARLVFCRSRHGRRVLLRARTRSLAAGLRSPVERRSMWL